MRVVVFVCCSLALCLSLASFGQSGRPVEPCRTMQRLESKLKADPVLRSRFIQQQETFNKLLSGSSLQGRLSKSLSTTVYVPIVFHIVMQNPASVTDAQILAQLDTLNKDFAGANGDSVKIPPYFKPLFGKSSIQFCLAQRTPDGDPTTGIVRTITSKPYFGQDDSIKHSFSGGDDSWDVNNYFNVWIGDAENIGYSTFPDDGPTAEQGVVLDYRFLPGGSNVLRNEGKVLTHETGHYFNLYHIWGIGAGNCTGTDYVDDTPNQSSSTWSCPTGIVTDACTPAGNGIMYQNYMDYSFEPCQMMFTTQQVVRMEAAFLTYRPSLLSSTGCKPGAIRLNDAKLGDVTQPVQRICSTGFIPVVQLRNKGTQPLTSLLIQARVDNGAVTSTNWTGNLLPGESDAVTLGAMTAASGDHVLTVYASRPNGTTDENTANDTVTMRFQNLSPVSAIAESFEGTMFPPLGWDIVNGNDDRTWRRTTAAAKTGMASAVIENFSYYLKGRKDDLRLPALRILIGVESAFLSFQVAAALRYGIGNSIDTLEVLASTDCGRTYQSLYRKWGVELNTVAAPADNSFVPSGADWRRDSANLSSYIGTDNLWLLFRNTTETGNNIYLDDIKLQTANTNVLSVIPNPTNGNIVLRFSNTIGLRNLQLFSVTGQKIAEMAAGTNGNVYRFDLGRHAGGVYIARAVFADKILTKKIVKY